MRMPFWQYMHRTTEAGRSRRGRRASCRRGLGLELQRLEERSLPSAASIINPLPMPPVAASGAGPIVDVGGTAFFTRTDPSDGLELWENNGSTSGPTKVYGWSPGSWVTDNPELTNVNGTLYFVANNGTGEQLWKSDGTTAGTVMVADIGPGPTGADPTSLTNYNGTLVFMASDGSDGVQLWESDGTAAGTTMVTNQSLIGANSSIGGAIWSAGGLLCFEVYEAGPVPGQPAGETLWESNGTTAGTMSTGIDLAAQEVLPGNGTLFINTGTALYASNGTSAGTVLLSTASSGDFSFQPIDQLTSVNGTVYFIEVQQPGPSGQPSGGWELWKSDGTAAGTTLVQDLASGPNYPDELTNVGGTLFFSAEDGTNGPALWESDGTQAGTLAVVDMYPSQLTNINGTLWFTANDGTHGEQIWTSDGTAAGTVMITDVPDNASVPSTLLNIEGVVGGTVYYDVYTATWTQSQLWETNGTAAGTSEVSTFAQSGPVLMTPTPVPTTTLANVQEASGAVTFAITPSNELYEHTADGWTWLSDNIQSVSAVAVAGSTSPVVFALTTNNALFVYNDPSGWQMIGAPNTVQEISAGTDARGQADVFVIGGDTQLTEWSTSSGWLASPIGAKGTIESISATADNGVVAVTTDNSIFEYTAQFGWFRLTSANFAQSISTVTNAAGDLVVFATTLDNGLYQYNAGGAWAKIGASGTIQSTSAGTDASGQANAFVITTGNQLAEYDSVSGWSTLSAPGTPADISAAAADTVFMILSDGSVYGHDDPSGFFPLASAGFGQTGEGGS
jgi:ELWxxDGT repeat protein